MIELVYEQAGVSRKRVTLDARLFHDLGVDGADGWDILAEFSRRYGVDISTVDVSKYFGPEAAATPFTLIRWLLDPAFRRGDQFSPIRVRDLVECARAGKWLL
jgi:acyl carrier protein